MPDDYFKRRSTFCSKNRFQVVYRCGLFLFRTFNKKWIRTNNNKKIEHSIRFSNPSIKVRNFALRINFPNQLTFILIDRPPFLNLV